MANYKLREDEIVLFKEECNCEGFVVDKESLDKLVVITLTNYNMVFSYKNSENEKLFIAIPLDDIKIYNKLPQVKIASHFDKKVEIYLTTQELYLDFATKKVAKTFINNINHLLKKSQTFDETLLKIKGGLNKAKQVIDAIDETFAVDTVAIATGSIKQQQGRTPQNKVVNVLNDAITIIENAKEKHKKSKTQALPVGEIIEETPTDSNDE